MGGTATIAWVVPKTGCADADVIAFLSATGITDSTIENALCVLVTSAKANGWWAKCIAIYPMVGGTSTTCKYNLKDPQNTNGAFRLAYDAGWSFSATGASPSNGYADTFIIPSSHLALNDVHSSYYSRENVVGEYDIGVFDSSGSKEFALIVRYLDSNLYSVIYDESSSIIAAASADGSGYFLNSRTSSNAHNVYRNGSSFASSANANIGVLPTISVYLGALNSSGTPSAFSTKECAFATFGSGIDASLAATMYTDIQTFQTALSRQV